MRNRFKDKHKRVLALLCFVCMVGLFSFSLEGPKAYATAVTDTEDFEELEKELNRQGNILYWFRDRLQYVSSYEKFLNQMEAQAAKSGQISIFKQDPFTVNRAQKTWEAFEKLKGTQLELLVSEGFSGLFDYQAADYIVVVSLHCFMAPVIRSLPM